MSGRANRLCLLACVLWWGRAPAARAADWTVDLAPAATTDRVVNADWRAHGGFSFEARWTGAPDAPAPRLTLFFETKQDLRFETRVALPLTGTSQTVRVSLAAGSDDWRCTDGRRRLGVDALRWVTRYGLKLYSEQPVRGMLSVGDLRFEPARRAAPAIGAVSCPSTGATNRWLSVRFAIDGFAGNPYDTREADVRLVWSGAGTNGWAPAYFRQEFAEEVYPGTGERRGVAVDLPHWQADWRPPREGTYRLEVTAALGGTNTLRQACGEVAVAAGGAAPAAVEPRPAAAPAADADLTGTAPTRTCFAYAGGAWGWAQPPTGVRFWRAVLDWTPRWGRYLGLGEYDALTAWRVERQAEAAGGGTPLPLLLFSEDELDNFGTYNWVDNPLNAANGGPLAKPSDFFTNPEARRWLLDRARYLWARFGRQPGVAGLLIQLDEPSEEGVAWVNGLAAELTRTLPGVRVLSDDPGLPRRAAEEPLPLDEKWSVDARLSPDGALSREGKRDELTLLGPARGSLAARLGGVRHWVGARVLTVDAWLPEDGDTNAVSAVCSLRTDENTVYQSRPMPLRRGEWNRVYFDLDARGGWRCLQDAGRPWGVYEALNVSEVALRFFFDQAAENAKARVRLRHAAVLSEYAFERERRPALAIANLRGAPPRVEQFDRVELVFDLNRLFPNPYDPDQVAVSVEWSDAQGELRKHPGFFDDPWDLKMIGGTETAVRGTNPTWRVRFTPFVAGPTRWRLRVRTPDSSATADGTFECVAHPSRGFLTRSKRDPHWFEFGDGSFFYPVGINMRSPSDIRPGSYSDETLADMRRAEKEGTRAYDRWFDRMRANGGNFTRVWMCPWWLALEWEASYPGYHGLDYYNEANAARLDRIMEAAQRDGIYVNLETLNHGQLSSFVDADWGENPMNRFTHPDGYLSYATDFLASERAQRAHRNKLRYTVARWGYSPAIAWWGVVTEAEWVEPYFRSLGNRNVHYRREAWIPHPYDTDEYRMPMVKWIAATADYIRRMDGHPHLVSAHFSMPSNGLDAWGEPSIEVVYNNAYTSFAWLLLGWDRQDADVCDVLRSYADYLGPCCVEKPLALGEWGGQPEGNREGQLMAEWHAGTWTLVMTRVAGSMGYWWWNLVDSKDLYPEMKAVSSFMRGEDRRGEELETYNAMLAFPAGNAPSGRPEDRTGLVLADAREGYAYIYDQAISRRWNGRRPTGFDDPSFPLSGEGRLTLPPVMQDGGYRVEYWNTFTGERVGSVSATVDAQHRDVPVLSHHADLAIKLKLVTPAQPAAPGTKPAAPEIKPDSKPVTPAHRDLVAANTNKVRLVGAPGFW